MVNETVVKAENGLDFSGLKIQAFRPLIMANWPKVYFGAVPYLEALGDIDEQGNYYQDTWQSIVSYFLANTNGFRGETAKAIKKELHHRLKINRMNP
jgi:hypothetical protein